MSLDGTVTDDGLPNPPSSVTTTWTQQSGPGTVTFNDANAVDTTASFSAAGTYVLRLTADDADLSNYDEVTITVNGSSSGPEITEDWTAANGNAWPSQWTREDISGTAPAITVYNNKGRINNGGDTGTSLMYINTAHAENIDQTATIYVTNNSTFPGFIARRADNDADTYYDMHIGSGAGSSPQLKIRKVVDGTATVLGYSSDKLTSGSTYHLRFLVQSDGSGGTDLKAKVWQDGSSEPTSWNLEINGDTESKLQGVAGRFGVKAQVGVNNRLADFDNYEADILDPTSVTEDWTGTTGSSWSSQWTREDLSGTAPTVTINNNEGRINNGGDTGTVLMYVNNANAEDIDQAVTLNVTNNSVFAGFIARRSDNDPDTYYDVRIGSGAGSNPQLKIRKVVDGTVTVLGYSSDKLTSGSDYHLRFLVQSNSSGGTDLKAKVWQDGSSEPGTWNLEVNNDTESRLQGISGRFGLKVQVGVNNRLVDFDDYEADILRV